MKTSLRDRLRERAYEAGFPKNQLYLEAVGEISRLEELALMDDCERCSRCDRIFDVDAMARVPLPSDDFDPLCKECV